MVTVEKDNAFFCPFGAFEQTLTCTKAQHQPDRSNHYDEKIKAYRNSVCDKLAFAIQRLNRRKNLTQYLLVHWFSTQIYLCGFGRPGVNVVNSIEHHVLSMLLGPNDKFVDGVMQVPMKLMLHLIHCLIYFLDCLNMSETTVFNCFECEDLLRPRKQTIHL